MRYSLSRRSFVAGAATLLTSAALGGAFASAGCRYNPIDYDVHDDDQHISGLSVDTEYPSYALTLTGYADSYVKKMTVSAADSILDKTIKLYQEQDGRSNIDIQIHYLDASKLEEQAASGFEGDFVIAAKDVLYSAADAGTVYSGIAKTSIRTIAALSHSEVVVARKKGSKVDMPDADTLDGEDYVDTNTGTTTSKMQKLPSFGGSIGVPAGDTRQGAAVAQVFYAAGLYSSEDGYSGTYDSSVVSKIQIFDDAALVCKALISGEIDLGFVFNYDLSDDLESIYEPQGYNGLTMGGASVAGCAEGGTARDFLQFLALR